MEESKPNNFINGEILKMENRLFCAKIIFSFIGYLLITFWLNSVRATAPIWFVWVLIGVQLALYLSIFVTSYYRSKDLGLEKNIGYIIFFVLAVLGRVNDWEVLVIPVLVIIMLILSAKNKRISDRSKLMLSVK